MRRFKVDALPETPDNAPLRHIMLVYTDAAHLMTANLTRNLDAAEVKYFKTQYASLASPIINDLPDQGFGSQSSQLNRDLGANSADFSARVLLVVAQKELDSVK